PCRTPETVPFTLTPLNQPPRANDDNATVLEGGSVTVAVLGNDTDPDLPADTLTVLSVTQGSNGSVVNNAGANVTYTHNGSETTSDSFTYTISDGHGGTASATVHITVTPVNDPPVANNDSYSVNEGAT